MLYADSSPAAIVTDGGFVADGEGSGGVFDNVVDGVGSGEAGRGGPGDEVAGELSDEPGAGIVGSLGDADL